MKNLQSNINNRQENKYKNKMLCGRALLNRYVKGQ